MVRALKKFRHLLSHNRVHLLVPHASVKDFLLDKDINEKRFGWITKVIEYDVDMKITKLVRGKGLCKWMLLSFEEIEEVALVIEDKKSIEGDNQSNWL